MYQAQKNTPENFPAQCIKRLADNAFIPFDPANTDYQAFKKDIAEGASMQDADGNEMTAEQIKQLLDTLE